MNELKVFKNSEFGEVRTVAINNEPYFVGKDIAGILGYSDTFGALKKHVDEEDKQNCQNDSFESPRGLTVINESGLYSLMLSFISMHKANWKKHSYAAGCCVSDRVTWQMMKDNLQIDTVYLCLDNDEAGQKANKRTRINSMKKEYKHKSSCRSIKIGTMTGEPPGGNRPHNSADFFIPNKDEEEGEEQCQALQL